RRSSRLYSMKLRFEKVMKSPQRAASRSARAPAHSARSCPARMVSLVCTPSAFLCVPGSRVCTRKPCLNNVPLWPILPVSARAIRFRPEHSPSRGFIPLVFLCVQGSRVCTCKPCVNIVPLWPILPVSARAIRFRPEHSPSRGCIPPVFLCVSVPLWPIPSDDHWALSLSTFSIPLSTAPLTATVAPSADRVTYWRHTTNQSSDRNKIAPRAKSLRRTMEPSMSPGSNNPAITPAARRTVDLRFVELIDKVRKNRPGDDLDLLRRAYDFAAEQHHTQTRLSGEPFLSHPVEVAHLLADMKLDVTTLCAALLHDVVEDTKIPLTQIADQFGDNVARLVEGATKISRLDLLAPEARQAENVRKMLLAMVNDVRVILVKLADRLHNMRTLGYLDYERQQRIARETMDIYAPVANRLGMGLIRGELEDLAFRYLEPESYLELTKKLSTKQKVFDKFLLEVQGSIRGKMVENGIPAEVQGRVKRLYSLNLKIHKQQRTLDQVFDLLAVRLITDTVKNC